MDSHSKWLEVLHVSSVSSSAAMNNIRSRFAIHGLPDSMTFDNGATFTYREFSDFFQEKSN